MAMPCLILLRFGLGEAHDQLKDVPPPDDPDEGEVEGGSSFADIYMLL